MKAGRSVVTTRDAPGTLDRLLAEQGIEVVHVPLIEIAEPADGGVGLAEAMVGIDEFDWVVVTSRHGAQRFGAALGGTPLPSDVRTAAVGTATAQVLERLIGRPVDLVPRVQRATALVETFADAGQAGTPWRILVAQADRAEPTLAAGLTALGHDVEVRVAYSTRLRLPSAAERVTALTADAVAFASGSAAEAWANAIGASTPPVVCAIGPTTARVAADHGLTVTHIASEHSVAGLAACVVDALSAAPQR